MDNAKPRIKYPIVVEGKYDRQKVLSAVDADCLSTDGFGIFNNSELCATLCVLSSSGPIIVLTDSDSAGALIRKRISQAVRPDSIINLYTPQIKGKEKRKKAPSKEGFLGVEGVDVKTIREILLPFASDAEIKRNSITKATMYLDGLTGCENSSDMRDRVAAHFSLPKGMTPNALLCALSYIATDEEYRVAVERANSENNK